MEPIKPDSSNMLVLSCAHAVFKGWVSEWDSRQVAMCMYICIKSISYVKETLKCDTKNNC